jgi:hypothetical protein
LIDETLVNFVKQSTHPREKGRTKIKILLCSVPSEAKNLETIVIG